MRKVYDIRYQGGKCPLGYEYVEPYSRDGIYVRGYCRKINSRKARKEAQYYERLDNERAEERQDFWSHF
ncbi:MAG: hypothetical protein M1454_01580 [Candidatus Thermoplasmatota archaeon]|nr:hypothetical protein [Candidatus Thermoplasmatota archaeon]MCL5730941.1 hypothetical protein [Candidatus Thermoplasmatota archaeon]